MVHIFEHDVAAALIYIIICDPVNESLILPKTDADL